MSTLKVTNLRHESASSDNISLTSTARVGIGTSSPSVVVEAQAAQAELQLKSTSGTNSAGLRFVPGGETNALYIYADGSRNINFDDHATSIASFRASGGLTFNGDTAAANALDDYEEGTHTCTAENSVTLYSTDDQISYTKIGRMVTIGGQVRVNSSNSNSQLELSLPFACKNNSESDAYYVGSVRFYSADVANDAVWVIAQSNPGQAKVSFINVRDNTSTSNVLATDNGYYMFTLTYPVD